jgi:putative nucleotidyltransferase with HDIG domain
MLDSRAASVPRRPHRLSLFSQPLDRAAFVAYFLGAVVPLAALAWVVQHFVKPSFERPEAHWILLGGLSSIGLLSLGSFLALRKTAHAAVARLDRENRRLQSLLDASHDLALAGDSSEVFQLSAIAAMAIAGSGSAHVLVSGRDGEPQMVESTLGPSSDDALATISDAAAEALETRRSAMRGSEEGAGGLAEAMPFGGGPRPGTIVVWHDADHPLEASARSALSTLASLVTVALRNEDLREAERNFFTHATSLLVSTLDRYLDERYDHSRRVASLANRIGRTLGLPESRLERLHFASLLHDIGMLRIARENVADREERERHPALGAEMLEPIRLWEDLAPFVRHHHEWWDGGGYPAGLAGEQIPYESRIIAVAEAFDTMTSIRSYQRPVSIDEAILRLRGSSGTQFDPEIVDAMLELRENNALG